MALLTLLFEIILLGISAFLLYVYYIEYKHSKYFAKWGIPYTGSGFFRILCFLRGKITVPEMDILMYHESKEAKSKAPFVGCTDSFSSPAVVVTDLDLARNILVKDFDHFVNRRKFMTQKGDLLFHRMFSFQENEQWRGMRTKLSPTFTTGKIRRLFNIFDESSGKMCDYMKRQMCLGSPEGELEISDVFSKYTMDVIANCAFAIDSKTFECGPSQISKFEEMAQQLQLKFSVCFFLKFIFILAMPKVAEFFGLQVTNPTPQYYFQNVVHQVLKDRRETGHKQEDFLQLMMEIQKGLSKEERDSTDVMEVINGTTELKTGGDVEADSTNITFDDDDITANSCMFLLAGFETVHSLLIYMTYALAMEQEVQQKLFEEIRKSMDTYEGKLSYEAIHEMKYLDMFVNETLRFYPPALRTERICTTDYQVPGTNAVIEKGVILILPIIGIHRDSDNFECAERFDPERFLPDKKNERHPYAWSGPKKLHWDAVCSNSSKNTNM